MRKHFSYTPEGYFNYSQTPQVWFITVTPQITCEWSELRKLNYNHKYLASSLNLIVELLELLSSSGFGRVANTTLITTDPVMLENPTSAAAAAASDPTAPVKRYAPPNQRYSFFHYVPFFLRNIIYVLHSVVNYLIFALDLIALQESSS